MTKLSRPIRIGCLGAARITPKALIDPAWVVPAVRIESIAARDGERAAIFADKNAIGSVHVSYGDLIADDEIDVVYNALPIDGHAQWSIAALEAGKHVVCEKPLAMHAGQARAMLAAAQASGKRLIEAFHYRYHPGFLTCLGWIADGRIGAVRRIDAHFNVAIPDNGKEIRYRPERGGGAMMDLGCYPLSWALNVCPGDVEIVSSSAVLARSGVDEAMTVDLQFAAGAEARISANMAPGTPFSAYLKVSGTGGEIEFTNPLAPHLGAQLVLRAGGRETEADISPISTYTYQLAAIANALLSQVSLPTEGAAILRQQTALDAVYAGAGLGHLRSDTGTYS